MFTTGTNWLRWQGGGETVLIEAWGDGSVRVRSAIGDVVDHEYEIESERGTIAKISKRWFRARDTYGVEIAPFTDVVLILSVTVAVDAMSHDR